MTRPLVSVVMPAFNAAATLAASVRSVLDQTLADIELIVCDDASNDETPEVLAAFDDSRLRVLRNEINLGPGGARDRAIQASVAPWIAVIDADDVWAAERLETLLEAVGDNTDTMVFDDIMICHDVAGALSPWKALRGPNAFNASNTEPVSVSLASYIRSDRLLIKPVMPARHIRKNALSHSERTFAEDAEFFIKLAGSGVGFLYFPEPLYLYRVGGGSVTALSKDVRLMRFCMQDCASGMDWPEDVQKAFSEKILALRSNETLYAFRDCVSKGEIFRAVKVLLSDYQAVKRLPIKMFRYGAYQCHRWLSGGQRR